MTTTTTTPRTTIEVRRHHGGWDYRLSGSLGYGEWVEWGDQSLGDARATYAEVVAELAYRFPGARILRWAA